MLLQFSVSNFRAFRGRQTLDFSAAKADRTLPGNWTATDLPGLKGRHWLKGAAIYGANASGKSTVLEAMRALTSLIHDSAKTTDPKDPIEQIEPFALDPEATREPTAFAIVFVTDGVRYEYRVAATRRRIIHESLRSFPKGTERLWFVRDWKADAKSHTFEPEEPKGMPRHRDIEKRTLPNMLYLSKAIAENRSELEPIYRWFVDKLKFVDASAKHNMGSTYTMRQLENEDSSLGEAILTLLRHADIGITGADLVEDLQTKEQMKALLRDDVQQAFLKKGWQQPQLSHHAGAGLSLPLPWNRESAGTHRLFALAGPILDILRKGYTACIDELETSMHPLMVRELLKLFFSEEENSKNAQLLFTTHNPLILDSTLIRRDQVWFTDKDKKGQAHLYPLTDYQPRINESLVRGYMAGRYGGVPFVPNGLLGSFGSTEEAIAVTEGVLKND